MLDYGDAEQVQEARAEREGMREETVDSFFAA